MDEDKSCSGSLAPRNVALSDAAIEWVVQIGSGEASNEDRTDFSAWCARSPAHAAAAVEAEAMFGAIDHSRSADEYRTIGNVLRRPMAPPELGRFSGHLNRRNMLAGGLAVAASVVVVSSGAFGPTAAIYADYSTGVGERRRIVLSDGSTIWLNTSSAVSVDFSGKQRRLTLHDGEGLFEVAKDASRPFIVASGRGEARAVGTVYSVRRRGALSDVVVTEGIVEVSSGAGRSRLVAGQKITYSDSILSAVRAVDAETQTGWSRGKLIFNRRPLADVARELERYYHGKIIVRGERLQRLEVTGVFSLGDPDALFRAISATTHARITSYPMLTIIH